MKKVAFAVFLLVPMMTWAQGDIDDLMSRSIVDGEKLIKGYVDPFMKTVSLGLNSGWYNTAKAHKTFGVDLTITASALTVPTSDLYYDVSKLNLTEIEMVQKGDPVHPEGSPDYPKAPTIFGPDVAPLYKLKGSTNPDDYFETTGGMDLKDTFGKNWMPVPMVTLGIGLPKGTDLKFRFSPSVDAGDYGKAKLLGFGLMHDVKQYIPGLKLLPFDLSAFVGWTQLSLDYKYTDGDVAGSNQRGEFKMTATTIQGLISKKISVLTLYGGLGYNIANSKLAVKGDWDVDDSGTISDLEHNPVDLKFSASGFRATAGFRLKLAVFTLHTDYTLQKYNALTVGFGINVR